MTLQEMKYRKKELGYTNEDLARLSGVPVSTINKIFSGATSAPRRATLLALESVLAVSVPVYSEIFNDLPQNQMLLNEAQAPYQAGSNALVKRQGEYTLEDYLAFPEDMRVELIDGVIYDMGAPYLTHQFIATQIGYQLMSYVEERKGDCKPVLSPVDVQLDKDDKTVVQPDVMILCRPELLVKNNRVFGAPDFIIEILSKSTRKKDMTLKLHKYANAGVREYWMIDPESLTILVYDLMHESMPAIYNFKSRIPVMVWDGDFEVDFQKVYDYAKDYLPDDDRIESAEE